MAMLYSRLYFGFLRHHKTRILKKKCGAEGVLCLLYLWELAGQRYSDGIFKGDATTIEILADWDGLDGNGPDGLFFETITAERFGFMEKIGEEEYRLRNWAFNNPHLMESAKTMRQGRARAGGTASKKPPKEDKSKTIPEDKPLSRSKTRLTRKDIDKISWLSLNDKDQISVELSKLPFPISLNGTYHKDFDGYMETFRNRDKSGKAMMFKALKEYTRPSCKGCGSPFINDSCNECISCQEG